MDIRVEKVRMLVAITERGNGKNLTRRMETLGVGCLMRCYGQGTASSEMMERAPSITAFMPEPHTMPTV